ncbi:bacterial regulatory s, tetR family protein [Yersinia ruckeri]|uniref:TetR/AcrR family transcriptional regulator n=1 Tax=Yersinia ruckeri TaxID=29486 RepID=UPI0005ACA443|nr:TetR/AcrR family transcriptional regulator [Yersinia ruckeri]AJI95442.1 bacterial regulatory s, tetR family protein [Yersinia ruckeri]MCW6569648.1 TetR/AcrR family transcriptional regulator [Yersinia ruckeri]
MTKVQALGRPSKGAKTLSKAEILKVALELLDGDGGENISFRLIAQRMGVTAMAVAHHIGSRRNMFEQLASEIFSDMGEAPEGETPSQRIRFLLDRYCNLVLAHPNLIRGIFADPTLFPEQLARLTELIKTNIVALTKDEQPDILLNIIVDYTHGFALSVTAGENDTASQLSSYHHGLDWIIARIPTRQNSLPISTE